MRQTQKQFVVQQLNETGEITRNMCLKNYITRLASIIPTLQKEGWEFKRYYREENGSKDYVYQVIFQPGEIELLEYREREEAWAGTQSKLFNTTNGPE